MNRYQIRTTTAVIAAGALCAGSMAATAESSKLSDLLKDSGIAVSGYVAASYFHSSEANTYHNYDVSHDTFQLDQAGLTVAYQPEKGFGAVVNLIAGEDARLQNLFESAASSSPSLSSVDVLQAYAQYATGSLTLMAGKFVTLAGAEVIAPTGNTNFSRSLLFAFEPATHTGVRATYVVNKTVSVTLGANNGWNYTSTSYGSKTAELGISLTPVKSFALTAQAYIGKDPLADASKQLVDLVATYTPSDMLSFVLSVDSGKQESHFAGVESATWNGVGGYVNVKLNSQWRLSVRGEVLDDKDGFLTQTGLPQKLKEGTVTLGYTPVDHFELRLEGRYDKAPASTIQRFGAVGLTDKQSELAIQGVYKF